MDAGRFYLRQVRAVRNFSFLKPKFHFAGFYRNFPAGKVVETNHESRKHKQSRHVEMIATKSVSSPHESRRNGI